MEIHNLLDQTMLIERLCGVGVYTVILAWVYLKLKNALDYQEVRKILNLYIVILTVMAFYYIPANTADLARWIYLSEGWPDMPFNEFYENYVEKSSVPVAYIMIYLCRLTGIDGALPAFCAFIFYNNVFYILKDLYKNHDINTFSLALTLLFFMVKGDFLEVISGVRCFVALSIIAKCFYDEFFNNKSVIKNLIWEIAASLIHPLALVLFIVRIAFMLLQKRDTTLQRIATFIVVCVFIPLLYKYGQGYFNSAINRADGYISSSDEVYSYSWEYMIGIILLIVFFVIMAIRQKDTDIGIKYKNIVGFNVILLALEAVYSFEYNTFHRVVTFSSIMIMPILAKKLNHEDNLELVNLIKLVSWAVLLLACARGNLCGYKFFLLNP